MAAVAILALGASIGLSRRASQERTPPPQLPVSQATLNPTILSLAAPKAPASDQGGQIRPLTQAEAQQLARGIQELLNQSQEGLKSVKHPDGSVSMDLQGRFQNVAVAKQNEDGTISQACVDNLESAAAFFEIDPHLVTGQTKTGAPQTVRSRVSEKPSR